MKAEKILHKLPTNIEVLIRYDDVGVTAAILPELLKVKEGGCC